MRVGLTPYRPSDGCLTFFDLTYWAQDWQLSVKDQRRLYLLISETLASEGKDVESQKVRCWSDLVVSQVLV